MKVSLYDTKTWPRSLGDDPEKAKTFTGVAYEYDYETQQVYKVAFQNGRSSWGDGEFDMSRSRDPLMCISRVYWSAKDARIVGELNNIQSALSTLEDYEVELSVGSEAP